MMLLNVYLMGVKDIVVCMVVTEFASKNFVLGMVISKVCVFSMLKIGKKEYTRKGAWKFQKHQMLKTDRKKSIYVKFMRYEMLLF